MMISSYDRQGASSFSGPVGNGASGPPRVSPSKETVRRVDPSLSFELHAPGAVAFDIVVATDPALFDAAAAHRRTPANFRSSRQDFGGQSIDIATGFYMLPRAFLRDTLSQEPRPTRLYYVAEVHYGPDRPSRKTVPEGAWQDAPSVGLAPDIAVGSLSKVLGVAVERLGMVSGQGRVSRPLGASEVSSTPARPEIGGLPLSPLPAPVRPARPLPAGPDGGTGLDPRLHGPAKADFGDDGRTRHDAAPDPTPPAGRSGRLDADLPRPGATDTSNFVDEDVEYGNQTRTETAFRDVDAGSAPGLRHAVDDYDDGFGAALEVEPPGTPIPALDPLPDEEQNGVDPNTPRIAPAPAPPEPDIGRAETPSADALVRAVLDQGLGGRYGALNLDGAYRGRLGADHPYYQRAHDGLSIGPHGANQDSGELGELLGLMQAADPEGFSRIFGSDADALVALTTAPGPSSLESPGGRSARVQPLGGADLWEDPWLTRFRAAVEHAPFQAAMRAQIIARRLEPMLPVARALGIDDETGRRMILVLALHLGVAGARATLRAAVNPLDTPAKTAAALDALGHAGLEAFQTAQGLAPTDTPDTETHFALIAALRDLGDAAPVQVPDAEAVKDQIVTAVPPGALGDALLRLRVGTGG